MAGYAKDLKFIRWIYPLEGISFVVTAILAARYLGFSGVILMAILADVVWSTICGIRWAKGYFGVGSSELLVTWLKPFYRYFALMLLLSCALVWSTAGLANPVRLAIQAAGMSAAGISLLWFCGLTEELRKEATRRFDGFLSRSSVRVARGKAETQGLAE
jgi:hypothetical protein